MEDSKMKNYEFMNVIGELAGSANVHFAGLLSLPDENGKMTERLYEVEIDDIELRNGVIYLKPKN